MFVKMRSEPLLDKGCCLHAPIQATSQRAFDRAPNVAVRFALGHSLLVALRLRMAAQARDGHRVQSSVQVSVSASVQLVTTPLSTVLASIGAVPARVAKAASLRKRPRWDELTEKLGGDDRADAGLSQKDWTGRVGLDQGQELRVQLHDLSG